MLKNPRHRFPAGSRGTALIEFAFVLPFLLVLTFLVVDFSRAFLVKNMLVQSAREGARVYAVGFSATDARTRAKAVAAGAGMDSSRVTVTPTTIGSAPDQQARVSVSYPFNWIYPGLLRFLGVSSGSVTLTASCTMRLET